MDAKRCQEAVAEHCKRLKFPIIRQQDVYLEDGIEALPSQKFEAKRNDILLSRQNIATGIQETILVPVNTPQSQGSHKNRKRHTIINKHMHTEVLIQIHFLLEAALVTAIKDG